MAVLIVDVLEPVEVDEQHGRSPSADVDPRASRGAARTAPSGRDAGERVGSGGLFECFSLAHDLGDVAADPEHAHQSAALVEFRDQSDLVDALFPVVRGDVRVLDGARRRIRSAAPDRGSQLGELTMEAAGARPPHELLRRCAHEAGECRVDVQAAAVGVPAADVVGRVLGEAAEVALAGGDVEAGIDELGHIVADGDRARHVAMSVELGLHDDDVDAVLAVRRPYRHLDLIRLTRPEYLQQAVVVVTLQRSLPQPLDVHADRRPATDLAFELTVRIHDHAIAVVADQHLRQVLGQRAELQLTLGGLLPGTHEIGDVAPDDIAPLMAP